MTRFWQILSGVEKAPLPASTPDITRAQVGGWLQFAASVGVGTALLSPTEGAVLIGASGVVAFGIHLGDAIIRHGRAGAVAALQIANRDGQGTMGSTAPPGDRLEPAPTLDGDPDGTGTMPDESAQKALAADDAAQLADSSPATSPPVEPPAPPVATAEEIGQARQDAEAAQERLAALLASVNDSTTPQQ